MYTINKAQYIHDANSISYYYFMAIII